MIASVDAIEKHKELESQMASSANIEVKEEEKPLIVSNQEKDQELITMVPTAEPVIEKKSITSTNREEGSQKVPSTTAFWNSLLSKGDQFASAFLDEKNYSQ